MERTALPQCSGIGGLGGGGFGGFGGNMSKLPDYGYPGSGAGI
jgi:hypothetical protein